MKKIMMFALATTMFVACNKKVENTAATEENSTAADTIATATQNEVVYVCPMHPEVTGKEGDKCPKCEMDLVPKE